MWPFRKAETESVKQAPRLTAVSARVDPKISLTAAARFNQKPAKISPYAMAEPMPGVLPQGMTQAGIAQDYGVGELYDYTNGVAGGGALGEGLAWFGFQLLAEMAQRPEYRRMAEVIAKEMTRRWIKLSGTGEEDKSERIGQLDAALKRFRVRECFASIAELDGLFGGAHLYPDTGATSDPDELETPLIIDPAKIGKNGLKRLIVVEPMWTYPNGYSSTDPLDRQFYQPAFWFVQGRKVHATRLMTFVGREVPDLLKPAYSFRGLSLSQMAKPYVDNWLQVRDNVSYLIETCSQPVLGTDLDSIMNGGSGEDLANRINLFTNTRSIRGTMVVNVASEKPETLANVSIPLSGLDALQAQAQEHMASVCGIPLVKLFGIQPTGLNASSDGEIRVFYDWIHAQQEHLFAKNLRRVIEIVMLSEWGEIDPDIDFSFEPLWQMDDMAKATIQKLKADTDAVLSEIGEIGPEDGRRRLSADEESPYHGLDPNDLPELPENDPAAENMLEAGPPDHEAQQAEHGAEA